MMSFPKLTGLVTFFGLLLLALPASASEYYICSARNQGCFNLPAKHPYNGTHFHRDDYNDLVGKTDRKGSGYSDFMDDSVRYFEDLKFVSEAIARDGRAVTDMQKYNSYVTKSRNPPLQETTDTLSINHKTIIERANVTLGVNAMFLLKAFEVGLETFNNAVESKAPQHYTAERAIEFLPGHVCGLAQDLVLAALNLVLTSGQKPIGPAEQEETIRKLLAKLGNRNADVFNLELESAIQTVMGTEITPSDDCRAVLAPYMKRK